MKNSDSEELRAELGCIYSNLTFNGWEGWKPSNKARSTVDEQLIRLAEAFPMFKVSADVYVRRATSWDYAIAYLHVYFNGLDAGLPWVKDCSSLGVRVYADEINRPDMRSPGGCVTELCEQLPQHVEGLIAHRDELVRHYQRGGGAWKLIQSTLTKHMIIL